MATGGKTPAVTRSDPGSAGIRRRRRGRGFSYIGPDETPVKDPRTLARIRSLVIPPAWEDVWICADPCGHILRDVAARHMDAGGLTRERVLAAAVRLIDLGFFRPGGQEYAEENGTFGLATIRKDHVTLSKGQLVFEYLAKGARHREQAVAEDQVCAVVRGLKRRRSGGDQLLAYRNGRGWRDVCASDINAYLGEISGGDFTAKDFRTWHATVLAAVGLAVSAPAATGDGARKRAVARVVREVAGYLGNTTAVTRASYIDPRVIELYSEGITIAPMLGDLGEDCEFGDLATRGRAESAVVKLLVRHAR